MGQGGIEDRERNQETSSGARPRSFPDPTLSCYVSVLLRHRAILPAAHSTNPLPRIHWSMSPLGPPHESAGSAMSPLGPPRSVTPLRRVPCHAGSGYWYPGKSRKNPDVKEGVIVPRLVPMYHVQRMISSGAGPFMFSRRETTMERASPLRSAVHGS